MPPDEVLLPLVQSPTAYVLVAVLGLLFGSFANVCIYRWPPSDQYPHGRSVVMPGSHCFVCGAPVAWYDNVPLLSYLLLRGRCRRCGTEFSARYLLVEALVGMLFVAAYHVVVVAGFPGELLSVRMLRFVIVAGLFFVLTVIAFIDLDHQLILDKITYPAIPAFYGLGLLLPGREPWDGLIGAAIGYGLVRLVSDGYYYLTGREGLGYGDGKLLAMIGALYGWQAVLVSLFVGSLAGSVIGITAVVVSRSRGQETRSEQSEGARELGAADGADAAGGPTDGNGGAQAAPQAGEPEIDGHDGQEDIPLRHVALPFGPFLAMGAVVYALTEPWLLVGLTVLWTTDPSML